MDLVALLHELCVGRGPGGRRHLVAEEEQGEGAEDEGPGRPEQRVTSGAPPPLCHISFTTLPVKNRPFDTTFLGLGLRL